LNIKIKCEWIYCKYNQTTGECNCNKDIILRGATIEDLMQEGIIKEETQQTKENSSNVLICDNYETMN
jgi:hypothetical protein